MKNFIGQGDNMEINVRDRVILTSRIYGITKQNPVYGTSYSCKGIVTSIGGRPGDSIKVAWDNGTTNIYDSGALSTVVSLKKEQYKSIW